ncbi:MAG: hypothetical protein GY703_22335, partial [Gammaproteobacteria bacterium]|nr:hypothetical protein [Gammaproteobacteria bacterium]
AATGRKPSYKVDEGTLGTSDEVWRSTIPCYEGDGDLIDTEEGSVDPDFIDVGTYLRNMPFVLDPAAMPGELPADDPYAFSSDLYGAFTNAFYTTINRDPFEWSYDANPDPLVQDFVGYAFPLSAEDEAALGYQLVSGPRWRLKPNKFGQDLPGLEIPLIECSKPPFKSDNIKYKVGTPVTTVINLLDWDDDEGPSPLATSKGWVDVTANEFVTVAGEANGVPYTTNGLPMTNDFDLAVYVKGDSKSTAIYNAQLIIEYEGEVPVPPEDFDLELTELEVDDRVTIGDEIEVEVEVTNNGPAAASGTVTVTGVSNRGDTVEFSESFTDLADGEEFEVEWEWTSPDTRPSTISWTATVSTDGGDTNPSNDTATAQTKVRRN